MTGARTIRALYCNELEMSAGQNERAAMQRSRNHFGQLGRLAVCAMGRSDSALMHGGEHGGSACKKWMSGPLCGAVRFVRGLGGVKRSDSAPLASGFQNCRKPVARRVDNALDARLAIRPSATLVLSVLLGSDFPDVECRVVQSTPIHMVNDADRPPSMHKSESNAMGLVAHPVHGQDEITQVVNTPSLLASLHDGRPMEHSSQWVVGKHLPQLVDGESFWLRSCPLLTGGDRGHHTASCLDGRRFLPHSEGHTDRTVSSFGSCVSPLLIFRSVVKGVLVFSDSSTSCARVRPASRSRTSEADGIVFSMPPSYRSRYGCQPLPVSLLIPSRHET